MTKIIAQSERIFLRETTVDDAEFFYRLNLDPEVIRYTGDGPFDSVEAVETFLSEYDHFEKYNMGRWAVVEQSRQILLGWCGLKYHVEGNFVDLGYRFFRKYWGKGYATESSKLSLEHGFRNLDIDIIVGRADVRNTASIRVLEKLGMTKVGLEEEDGAQIVLYQLSKEDFLS